MLSGQKSVRWVLLSDCNYSVVGLFWKQGACEEQPATQMLTGNPEVSLITREGLQSLQRKPEASSLKIEMHVVLVSCKPFTVSQKDMSRHFFSVISTCLACFSGS